MEEIDIFGISRRAFLAMNNDTARHITVRITIGGDYFENVRLK